MGWFSDLVGKLDDLSPTRHFQQKITEEAGRLGNAIGEKWNWQWLEDEGRWVRDNPQKARSKGAGIALATFLGQVYGGAGGAGAGAAEGGTVATTSQAPVWNAALAESAAGTGYAGASSASMGYGGYAAAGGSSAVDAYLATGGSDGAIAGGEGGYAGMFGDSAAGGYVGPETLGGFDTASTQVGGFDANPTPSQNGGMFDSMQEYLRRMSKTPQGRAALARLASGAYGAYENRKLRKELRNVDITQQPGYLAGERAVKRRMASQGYGNSGNMLTELQEYGGRFYNDYSQNRRQEVGAKTQNLGNMMSLLGMMSSGG